MAHALNTSRQLIEETREEYICLVETGVYFYSRMQGLIRKLGGPAEKKAL